MWRSWGSTIGHTRSRKIDVHRPLELRHKERSCSHTDPHFDPGGVFDSPPANYFVRYMILYLQREEGCESAKLNDKSEKFDLYVGIFL